MQPELDDRSLVEAARRGDRKAMDQLLRLHHDRVHAICRRIVGNDGAADATQEALIAIVRGLPKFDFRSSFSTWSYRIATNACLDELRRRRRRPVTITTDDAERPHEHADPHATRPVDRIDDRAELEAALRSVPEDFRVPMVLRDVGDLDYAEIAVTLGVPVGTVKSRIARGRGMLAAALARGGNQSSSPRRPTEAP